jgi:hypothetical protein
MFSWIPLPSLNAEPHQNIVTVCLFTHLPIHSFFLDAIEEIYKKDASLSIFIYLVRYIETGT